MSESLNLPAEHPSILSFEGPDAARFLNGQITQDVSKLGNQALPACVTDARGRLLFFIKVFMGSDDESLWVTCKKEHGEGLRERLERYLIADDVEVHDLSDQWAFLHSSRPIHSSAFSRSAKGCLGEGYDCWWKTADLPEIDSIDEAQAERRRIAARIPAWGSELTEGMLPPEAGLDKTAVSYHKGCYVGQEVLSRIKSAGKLNRRLAAFSINGTASVGDVLRLDSKEVGRLTSCATPVDADTRYDALGFLKKQGFQHSELPLTDSEGNPKGIATFVGWA